MTRTPIPPVWDHRGRREWLRRRAHRQLVTFCTIVVGAYSSVGVLTVVVAR